MVRVRVRVRVRDSPGPTHKRAVNMESEVLNWHWCLYERS